jgi:hypothetical protein
MPRRTPPPSAFTAGERRIVESLRTPRQVQRYLRSLPYNWEKTLRTFRGVVSVGRVACLEAVLVAATILDQHGYPPLALDLESQDGLDHVLFVYRASTGWGTVARSRDEGLHGRKPVFPTVRALVDTYLDPYVDGSGRIVGYGVFDLDDLVRVDWRLGSTNVWSVERELFAREHTPIHMGERRYERALRRFQAFKEEHPVPTARDWRRHLAGQTSTWI